MGAEEGESIAGVVVDEERGGICFCFGGGGFDERRAKEGHGLQASKEQREIGCLRR